MRDPVMPNGSADRDARTMKTQPLRIVEYSAVGPTSTKEWRATAPTLTRSS